MDIALNPTDLRAVDLGKQTNPNEGTTIWRYRISFAVSSDKDSTYRTMRGTVTLASDATTWDIEDAVFADAYAKIHRVWRFYLDDRCDIESQTAVTYCVIRPQNEEIKEPSTRGFVLT